MNVSSPDRAFPLSDNGMLSIVTLEPSRLADFRLAGALGSGATARVFEAVHIATGRPVAIKMLEPSARGSELRERFAREALFLAGVTSRHVSRILGYGFDQGQPFLVLERLVGETLDAKLRRDGPVPSELAFEWIDQLLVGVRDIHLANVVHRDLKPGNIFIQRDGTREIVKVIDFGVARLLEMTDDGQQGLTSSSHLIGSVGYMAPEQFVSASKVGFGADLYALGVVIFRMITGQLPFVSKNIEAVIRMKREREPPVISGISGAPSHKQLDWFVSKALATLPANRFQTAREMHEVWQRVRPVLDLEEDATTNVDQIRSFDIPGEPSREIKGVMPVNVGSGSNLGSARSPAAASTIPSKPAPSKPAFKPAVSFPDPSPEFTPPRSFSPDSFVRTPHSPEIREASESNSNSDSEPPPQTMLSPGQGRDSDPYAVPSSRTGVDFQIPVPDGDAPSYDDWDAVTEKRKAPDILRIERELAENKRRAIKKKPL